MGITPAYAGKSQTELCGNTGKKDHPRVCGEKGSFSKSFTAFTGSPPRMRGKVVLHKDNAPLDRITPAYAGKSCAEVSKYAAKPDHPRVCGEKIVL